MKKYILKDIECPSNGQVIWWDDDSSCMPIIGLKGALVVDSRIIWLTGVRDVGIHTGHVPVLRPAKEKKWKVCGVPSYRFVAKTKTDTCRCLPVATLPREKDLETLPYWWGREAPE